MHDKELNNTWFDAINEPLILPLDSPTPSSEFPIFSVCWKANNSVMSILYLKIVSFQYFTNQLEWRIIGIFCCRPHSPILEAQVHNIWTIVVCRPSKKAPVSVVWSCVSARISFSEIYIYVMKWCNYSCMILSSFLLVAVNLCRVFPLYCSIPLDFNCFLWGFAYSWSNSTNLFCRYGISRDVS